MKNFCKKYKYELLAFLIPFVAAIGICIGNFVWPLGDNCMLHVDMYHQYCPFFTEFAEKLKTGGSLFYTWNLGLGSDYVSLYAYYLASPLNWLLVLCPRGLIIEFMELQILLKIGMCGLSMYLFLKYHMGIEKVSGESERAYLKKAALVFASAYAFCGFVAAYSWDIMWMDSVALLPLIILGLEKLVKEKKVALYAITLALSIWSNYYISIIICIFVVFYFAWLFFAKAKGASEKVWSVLRFGIYSLLAGGMSAVLILPEIAVLAYSGSSMGTGFPEQVEWYFNIIAELSRLSFGTEVYTGTSHWPNLYCGAFCILLVILYGFNRNISLKKKIPAYLMLAFFIVSFANNYLDFAWHGMHFPESLPGRQSFLFAFLMLTMAFHAWKEREAYKRWHLITAGGICLVLFVLIFVFNNSEITNYWCIGVTILFLVLYALMYYIRDHYHLGEIILWVAAVEVIANMALTGIGVTNREAYTKNDDAFEVLLSEVKEREGDDFYRVEDLERLTKNDSSRHTYSSTTVFSSLMNLDISHFYQSVYMEGGKNYYCYNGATPLTSALLSVDYVISEDALCESPYRTLVKEEGDLHLYQNTYSLPIGFMMDEAVIENWDNAYSRSTDRIDNLNELAALLGAESNYLVYADYVEGEAGETVITIEEDGYYYAGYVNCSSDRLYLTSSRGYERTFAKTSHRYLLELGWCVAGETITISNKSDEDVGFRVYSLNEAALQKAFDTLNEEVFDIESFSDTNVKGTVTTEGGRLIFSIPYVPGWTLYVDGVETEIEPFCDAFIAVNLAEGTHTVEVSYKTPNIGLGAGISALCLGLFVVLLIVRRFILCRRKSVS